MKKLIIGGALFLLLILLGISVKNRSSNKSNPIPQTQPDFFTLKNQQELISLLEKTWKETTLIGDSHFGYTEALIKDEGKSEKPVDDFPDIEEKIQNPISSEKDVDYINQTIESILAPLNLESYITRADGNYLKSLITPLLSLLLIERYSDPSKVKLFWCPCIPIGKRIVFSLEVLASALQHYPNTDQLTYTSFASGSLMQDLLTLVLLFNHYKVIDANLIDLLYPSIPELAKNIIEKKKIENLYNQIPFEQELNQHDEHILHLINVHDQAEIINTLKTRIAQYISSVKKDVQFSSTIFNSAYDYIDKTKKDNQIKSNILTMVDPNIGTFYISPLPSQANVLEFIQEPFEKPIMTLFLPRHQPAQLYFNKKAEKNEQANETKKAVVQAIIETNSNKKYNPQLLTILLKKAIEKIDEKEMTPELKEEYIQKQFPSFYKDDEEVSDIFSEEEISPKPTPLLINNIPVLLTYATDPHISFQDMVWTTLKPHAVVWTLYQSDPTTKKDSSIIRQINPERYKFEDVISPNTGKYLGKAEDGPDDFYMRVAL